MNSEVAIQVENLGKRYRLGESDHHRSLKARLRRAASAPWRLFSRDSDQEHVWALKDASFEVRRGEVLGVIGANGAGKSTLLKLLTQITRPTSGRAEIRGRVGSLLEVGTGFHPELTGRENVYLNGAILGMRQWEINRHFDEIIDFSGVEKFIDTPVKRYSSGMRVRLAFAVAAHLQPEILLVDEVLAVGDAEFQKKCLGRMSEVAEQGRTILFVSHNMGAIMSLCPRVLLLDRGEVALAGPPDNVISRYFRQDVGIGELDVRKWSKDRKGSGPMRVEHVAVLDDSGSPQSHLAFSRPLTFRSIVRSPRDISCSYAVTITNAQGNKILHFTCQDFGGTFEVPQGLSCIDIRVDNNTLGNGVYYLSIWLGDGQYQLHDLLHYCLQFEVISSGHERVYSKGLVRIPAEWLVHRGVPTKAPSQSRQESRCE